MKVSVLYILNFGIGGKKIDDESAMAAKGLFLKYHPRCEAAGVITVENTQSSLLPTQVKGPLPLNNSVGGHEKADQSLAANLAKQLPEKPQGQQRSVGVYVVMHGGDELAVAAKDVAQHLDEVMPGSLKPKLHYLAMIACSLATDAAGQVDLDRKDLSYMAQFMSELKARGMSPVVAGWDAFVTVAPHRPTLYDHGRAVFGSDGEKIDDLMTIAGRKIVYPNRKKYSTVDNEYRKLHKRVYRIKDGKLEVALGTWSSVT